MKTLPRILLCSFSLAITTLPSIAQQFTTPSFYYTGLHGAEPAQVVAADFNGDGNLDLAVANTQQGGVAIFLGNSDGTFNAAKHMLLSSPIALAVADVNGDGIPDLLIQRWGASGYLLVYLGKGDGTFTAKAKYQVGGYPVAVAVGDLNGDGIIDAVVASSNSDQKLPGYITVFRGKGDGTFLRDGHYSAGRSPWGIAIADLNGDGHPDIVVSSDNAYGVNNLNTLFVLLNNGDGTFTNGAVYQTGTESLNVSIADLNHDGKADLVVASAFNQGIQVLLGNGDGTFASPVFYSTSPTGAAPDSTAIAD